MRWELSCRAKVVGRANQARAEQPVPDSVNDDAGGQRVVTARQPLGQLAPAALPGRQCRRFAARRHLEEAARRLLAQAVNAAADVDAGILDQLLLLDRHHHLTLRSTGPQSL